MRGGRTLTAAVVVLAATACSAGAEPSPSATTSTASTASTAVPRPLTGAPLWTSSQSDLSAGAVQFVGDTVLIDNGSSNSAGGVLTARDAASGSQRWSIGAYQPFQGGDGALWRPSGPIAIDDDTVVLEYFATACTDRTGLCPRDDSELTDETGVTALSVRDGSVQWRAAAVPGVAPDTPQADELKSVESNLVGADATVVAVALGDGSAIIGPMQVDPDQVSSIGLDPGTGEKLWEADEVVAQAVLGGVVVGVGSSDGTRLDQLVGLDGRTGQQRWAIAVEYPSEHLWVGAGDRALVLRGTDQPSVLQLVDVTTGQTLSDQVPLYTCATDHVQLIACGPDDDSRILSLASGDTAPALSQPLPDAGTLIMTAGGLIVVDAGDGDLVCAPDGSSPLAVAGRVLGADGDLIAVAATSGWAMYRLPR